jgi:uncharacterized DUF497 family protein
MRFEWDAEKARRNLAKHGVSFEDAMLVWDDPHAEIVRDRSASNEERYWAVGQVRSGVLVAVHLYPDPFDDELVRIISARKAERHERKRYEDGDL